MLKTAMLRSKDAVNYREAPGAHTCGNCKYFDGDSGTCQLVAGRISADDLCDVWEGAPAYKEAAQARPKPAEVKEAQISRDLQVVTFALNLEYLEVEYYSGLTKVEFSDDAFKEFAEEILANEHAHVALYEETLGDDTIEKPDIDVSGFFTAVARAKGIVGEDEDWDPYANETNFFLGGILIEDVGVTVYNGAVPTIEDADLRQTISGVLAVEAYHMGMARSLLYLSGDAARDAHAKAVEGDDKSQPLVVDGKANFVPSKKGIAFVRSPREVLDIVMLKAGATEGGFFPKGLNGDIKGLL